MSSRESAMGHPDDIDRIALTVVEQIQQQMQVYEDAAASHSNEHDFKQVELHIQAKRIENILDTCLSKIEFALSMPWIFQSGAQNDECKSIQEKWKEIHERIESAPEQGNNSEMHVELYNCIESAYRSGLMDSAVECLHKMTDDGEIVIVLLRELKYFAEHKILMTAAKEMAKQKVLHRMWINNDNTVREIKRKRDDIESEECKTNAIIANKKEEIHLLERSKEILLTKNSKELNEKIIESNRIMHDICERKKIQQQTTEKVISEQSGKLQSLMKSDLAEERDMIEKKNALEMQLQEFIQKYDQDIGARNHHLQKCHQKLEQDKDTLAEWKAKYEAQEIIYNQILADKEMEETREREEKLLLFMMNRAAIIIQRAYRKILSKRKGKKKKGKKGGKK